jgi:hypothetical protein
MIIGFNAQQLADALKGGLPSTTPIETVSAVLDLCKSIASDLEVNWFADSGLTPVQVAASIRGSIVSEIQRGVAVAAIGSARGYLFPEDPLVRINSVNTSRRLFALAGFSETESRELVEATVDFVKLGRAYDAGTVSFDRPNQAAAQISSFDVSLDGMADQSGDPLVDLLGYQPDADFVKRKRAIESLSKLDFSKRKPYILFTADVIKNGHRKDGTVICWQKMRDASGYNITKRDVFRIIDMPSINVSNEALRETTAELLADTNFQQVLSFYDWITRDDIFAIVDAATHPDTVYSYALAGVQRKAPFTPFIFDVPMSALYLTAGQIESVKSFVSDEALDPDSISPYPALARVIYGDPGYAWILAGCNVLASQRRGDSHEQTRQLSYIGSKLTEILSLAASGKIAVPNDVSQIHKAIDNAIASYGVPQTILSLLDAVGVTQFAAGKDDPLGFKSTKESLEAATGGLAKILGVIDPQSATIDPKVLVTALAARTTSPGTMQYQTFQVAAFAYLDPTNANQATIRSLNIPSIESVVGDEAIDLTTYVGLSRLMHVLRTVYDFYPGSLT